MDFARIRRLHAHAHRFISQIQARGCIDAAEWEEGLVTVVGMVG